MDSVLEIPANSEAGETWEQAFDRQRIAHWDQVAAAWGQRIGIGRAYHARLSEIYRFLIPQGAKVLELGCGTGDLLSAVKPAVGVGVDFSSEMIRQARQRHPELTFVHADVHRVDLGDTFDVVILSDLVNDLRDVQTALARVARFCRPHTRLILNFYSRLWQGPLSLARWLGLAHPSLQQNWLTPEDVANLLYLSDFEVIRTGSEVLLPLPVPLLARACNAYLVKLWPFRLAALTNLIVARPRAAAVRPSTEGLVVVPARNEAGHIRQIFERTPAMAGGTELIFVEGGSTDDTYPTIEREMARHPDVEAKLLHQSGKGKGDAVRLGFSQATGDVLMILDADLTVPPETLPRFLEALVSGKCDFANGVRLVYPMEKRAMRFFNLVGNKFFSLAFSWLLSQPIKDTLCGTKVLWKQDYQALAAQRRYFGDFDPFGDFDLIFGAAKLNLKIVDLPIRYQERVYGETNIQRWRHGLVLLRMVIFAARRIKFV